MRDEDWGAFVELIQCADAVREKRRNNGAIAVMFRALRKYDIAQVREAIDAHVLTSNYIVSPADISRHIDGDAEERSLFAWELFMRAVDMSGGDDSVRFPDPAYHFAIEALNGWIRLGKLYITLTERELEFRKKDWRTMYQLGLRKASWHNEPGRVKVPPYLIGFFERDNREKGFPEAIPDVLIVETGKYVSREAIGAPLLPIVKPLMPLGGYGEPQSVKNILPLALNFGSAK